MRVERLTLKNFRNYRELDLQLQPGTSIFVGDNGQGKTNIVEAIYLVLRSESFRAGSAETFVSQTGSEIAPSASIKARVLKNDLHYDLDWSAKLGHKRLECNGKKTSGLQLSREFPVVLFSPESLASIKEGPEFRRRLVDDLLISHSTSGCEILKEYAKVLKTRNRVLKDFKERCASVDTTTRLLESLDAIFLPLSGELAWLRIQALESLKVDLQNAIQSVLSTSERVQIEYLISQKNSNSWDRSAIIDAMHQRGLELRPRELESGMTLVGPHRHDIRFLFAGKDSRYFCSQGQQRALILSYKMAQIMYHHRTHQVFPFLLLDDVLSELDPERRTNLVRFLKVIPSQIFLTTTDLSLSTEIGTALSDFGDRSLTVFRIDKGVIARAGNSESIRRRVDSSP